MESLRRRAFRFLALSFCLLEVVVAGETGKLTREIWSGIPGERIADLTGNAAFYGAASTKDLIEGSQAPSDIGDDYGQRLRGYVIPQVSGSYKFWIAADNNCGLFLSTDESKFNKRYLAGIQGTGPSYWVDPLEWDGLPSQQSQEVHLEAGHKYFIEVLHKEFWGGDHLAVAWQPPGGSRGLIPTAALESYLGDAGDLDEDELPDSWETSYGFDDADNGSGSVKNGPLGDPDEDGSPNIEEYVAGTTPVHTFGLDGALSRDVWFNIPGERVFDLVQNDRFFGEGDIHEFLYSAAAPSDIADDYGQRVRGYITAPVSGTYYFWIASDNNSELWLSTSSGKFAKHRIAKIDGAGPQFFVAPMEWDKLESQSSVGITLQAGKKYYLEALHKEFWGGDHLAIAWKVPGGQREVIPASALSAYGVDGNDGDDDQLPDNWEWRHGLAFDDNGSVNRPEGPLGDPDGDGYINFEEAAFGSAPDQYGGIPGYLSRQVWFGITGDRVSDLTRSARYAQTADLEELLPSAKTPSNIDSDYGQRLRGYVVAPQDGDYKFWISGDNNCELWLSPDASRFNKRRIAWIEGDGSAFFVAEEQWDKFQTQESKTIHLQQGQKYYFEVLHKEGFGDDHLSVAWQRPGGAREILPAQFLESNPFEPADVDDDDLPDAWEALHGLDPADNGSVDSRNGASGDADGDGIENLAEFRFGGDPLAAGRLEGVLSRDVWFGEDTGNLPKLTDVPRYYTTPNFRGFWDSSMLPSGMGDNYGQRLRGYLLAPSTGYYTFWIAGDDNCEFRLSSSSAKMGRRAVAWVHGAGHSWVDPLSWDERESQKSEPIFLEGGQRYYVEILHREGVQGDHLAFAWQRPGGARELIPSSAFESFNGDANDPDDDDLASDWEVAHGFDPNALESGNKHPLADPDGDGVMNRVEALEGTDPWTAAPVRGYLSMERWEPMAGYTINSLINSEKFYQPADRFALVQGSTTEELQGEYFASRVRGYIEAPSTGRYRFWLSASTAAELWLSEDGSKYRKQRIAKIDPELGHAHGISWWETNRWDVFAAQMSDEVELVQGQRYFVEVIQQHGHIVGSHISLAWAKNGGTRAAIPKDAVLTYAPENADGDDDYLPDSWESQHGLDPTENGGAARATEGDRGDFDNDGLSNREEYLAGTDPADSDSDDDGVSDLDELRRYGTDPTSSDVIHEQVIGSIPLAPASAEGTWTPTADGIASDSFRGRITWNVTVPSAGYWIVEVESSLAGKLSTSESLDLNIQVDGKLIERRSQSYRSSSRTTFRTTTPYLAAGSHEFSILIDNYVVRRSLRIHALRLVKPGGLDLNNDGVIDAVHQDMEDRNRVYAHSLYSHVSPFFLEGASRNSDLVDLTVIQRSGQVDRPHRYNQSQWDGMLPGFEQRLQQYQTNLQAQLRSGGNRMEGTQVPHNAGVTEESWYTFMELSRNEAIGYVALAENLEVAHHGTIVWTPINVLQGGEITIPVGSKLLMGAWNGDWDWKTVSLHISGTTVTFPAGESHVRQFNSTGTYEIVANHPDGLTGTLSVKVVGATFGATFECAEQEARQWNLPGVGPSLSLQAGRGVRFGILSQLTGGGSSVLVLSASPGVHKVAARIGAAGPILATGSLRTVGLSDAMKNDADAVVSAEGGYWTVRSPLVITDLPPGGYARVLIFRAGVMFEDGTTERIITADDLDWQGLIYLNYLFPAGMSGGYCHYIEIYDSEGNLLRHR